MPDKPHWTPKQMIAGIQGTGGIKTAICKNIGCSRTTFDDYLKKHPEIKEAFDEECESVGDYVESQIIAAIRGGDGQMMRFYAQTKMRNRGYGKHVEVDANVTGKTGVMVAPGTVEDIEEWTQVHGDKLSA